MEYEAKEASLKAEYEQKLESVKEMFAAKLSEFQTQFSEQREQAQLPQHALPSTQPSPSKKWSGKRVLKSKATRTDGAALAMILSIDNCKAKDYVFVQSDGKGGRFFEYPLESCLKTPVRGLLDAMLQRKIISSVALHESGKWRIVHIHESITKMKTLIPMKTLYWNGNIPGMYDNTDFDREQVFHMECITGDKILSFRQNEQNKYEIFDGRYNGTGYPRYKFFVIYRRSDSDPDLRIGMH